MKMDFRPSQIAPLIFLLALSACGKEKTPVQSFEKPAEECAADVVPQQFIAKMTDGSTRVVRAESTEAFLRGYATEHLHEIEFTEPDYYVRRYEVTPTVRETQTPPSSDNWGASRVGADALWSAGIRGAGVVVAVIDSGLDFSHPSFSGQIAVNASEIAGNGIDDDENGFIDDVNGYDFVKNRPLAGDYKYHGSHVAGIVAAAHADTVAGTRGYVQGIAPGAKILPLAFLDETGSGLMSNGVRAIKYAVTRGARVINASWGGSMCSRSLRDTVAALAEKNVIFVAAAGNDSVNIDRYKEYPASIGAPSQFTVGATGEFDYLAEYSNYGMKSVHIFAPGSSIVSTVPGGMATLSGTSMAAPFVTGAIALLLSAEPSATVEQIRSALYSTAFKQPHYLNVSSGRLDLRSTLTELRRQMGK